MFDAATWTGNEVRELRMAGGSQLLYTSGPFALLWQITGMILICLKINFRMLKDFCPNFLWLYTFFHQDGGYNLRIYIVLAV